MDNKEYGKVAKEAQRQGWRPKPTSSGEMWHSPDGVSKAAWHARHASSDPKALDALVRTMVKGGFIWPPPKRKKS